MSQEVVAIEAGPLASGEGQRNAASKIGSERSRLESKWCLRQ
jgi:hypothetical protein